jgi:hypothetical protein
MTRIVIVGSLPNGEIFNTGYWVAAQPIAGEAAANAFAVQARDAFINYAGPAARPRLSSGGSFDEVQVYHYVGTTGPADYIGTAAIGQAGEGTSSTQLPIQVALVTTLETGLSGRRRRGRMYWPCTNAVLVGHQVSQADIALLSSGVAEMFNVMNAAAGPGICVVLSQVGTGSAARITRVSCDSEPDVQRRRANRQTELRQSAADVAA